MKRRTFLASAATVLSSIVWSPCLALAKADFSFLDEMSEEELEELQAEVRNRLRGMDRANEFGTVVVTAVTEGEITFRGIPWGTTMNETCGLLEADGLRSGQAVGHDIYRPSLISYRNCSHAGDSVEDGGIQIDYSDVPVAGSAAEATLCFRYPLDDDGRLDCPDGSAQFYLARYALTFDDPLGAYGDIKAKLDGVYGECSVSSEGGWADDRANTWTDKDGNWVRLSLYEGYDEYTYSGYILLIYCASGAEDALDEIEGAARRLRVDAERGKRETNQGNVSGL